MALTDSFLMKVQHNLAFVIEDHKDIAEQYELTLNSVGFEVEVYYNGEDGLERLKQEPAPQLVLLDMHFDALAGSNPLTGNELAWEMWFELDQTYIIIITNYQEFVTMYQGREEVDEVYLKSNVTLQFLAESTKKYLNKKSKRKISGEIKLRR
jgi:DNA-binding response OmpR family regulator